ncbi:glucosyl-3-phosphoglycerate synthase [Streptomyces lunaelactis]|uniref:glucosyl-3-phosphoglycerate synthase n=1 Tax=Streptomyces lunaelactis TaxID=1535768 RepID=UPI0015854419|nr:glucosyl-3-phosphoglycerate synthase [Streptomyces lunaelactis]NUK04573.1 glucosyl-3-phosphoglycerate synthase [Streptomyces lunaelactis]NUK20402.1 glucosyl-3-phosphoglycerate synthase [Streptomyces lunaelactis]NUK26435.1 glucosyl-3-phosphoglycerate synthase [Streptomyces lunaelactis]NUK53518.1 glucosyl-3-phosphoglycerate synthase [Streptomyces lunaelactis]NUK68714.1 glucosyl-3-phosphoglycerate synthase [Streptomyces lunaelactis]
MLEEVERWLTRRSWSAADRPLDRLVAAKRGTTISVVLPALDEESTVGEIVTVIRRELMEAVPLVDELVVVDSGSTDRTPEVAAAAGARVVHRDAILPRIPAVPGKGEVLWRSLMVTSGDIVCFIDADLREFSADFVSGIVGPLLTEPDVQFVKGMYDRPLGPEFDALASGKAAGQGGRVTELVARPLLNLHWPQLAGFVQPLGGEYAARRSLLERLPFPVGYGVELGLLVDALHTVGLDALAQVDVGSRKHRHQDEQALGRMAAAIYRTAQLRLSRGHLVRPSLTQFERGEDGFVPRTYAVDTEERPPMREIGEYAARRAA